VGWRESRSRVDTALTLACSCLLGLAWGWAGGRRGLRAALRLLAEMDEDLQSIRSSLHKRNGRDGRSARDDAAMLALLAKLGMANGQQQQGPTRADLLRLLPKSTR